MDKLHALLDWKLLRGSHEFPGDDDGSCINEVAIVLAGFEYRQVIGLGEIPRCFSKTLACCLLNLSDKFDGETRQTLIPFAVRLPGSADSDEIERARTRLLAQSTMSMASRYAVNTKDLWESLLNNGRFSTVDERLAVSRMVAVMITQVIGVSQRAAIPDVLAALHAAFDIGNQADPIPEAILKERVQTIRELVSEGAQ